ncbi:hypothetical protein D9M68_388370 [compost metagenome]
MIEQRLDPAAQPIGYGDRDCRLHAGTPHQRAIPPFAVAFFEHRDDIAEAHGEKLGDRLHPQHQAGVDHILAGGAEMHVFRRLATDGGAQLPDEFRHDHAIHRHDALQCDDIGRKGATGLGDTVRSARWDDAVHGFRPRKRRLEGEHRMDVGGGRKLGGNRLITQKPGEIRMVEGGIGHGFPVSACRTKCHLLHGGINHRPMSRRDIPVQMSRKTVSFSPCR